MSKLMGWIAVILLLLIVLIRSVEGLADSSVRQEYARAVVVEASGRARAMVIEAQAESRLHTAQATAVTSAAMLPWGILGILGLLGLGLLVLLVTVLVLRQPAVMPQLPPPAIVYLPPPGMRRAEVWQALSQPDRQLIQAVQSALQEQGER